MPKYKATMRITTLVTKEYEAPDQGEAENIADDWELGYDTGEDVEAESVELVGVEVWRSK